VALRVGSLVASATKVKKMLYRMVIWRLRHFAAECRDAQQFAVDPMTRDELKRFEVLFQRSASEIETARETEGDSP